MKDKIAWAFLAVFITSGAMFLKDRLVWAGWRGPETQQQLVEVVEDIKETQKQIADTMSKTEKRVEIQEKTSEVQYQTLRDLMMEISRVKRSQD